MVDAPTTNYGLRTQELGSNIATWGDPNLNEVENCIDQILGKIKDIAITGDYTITSTNYVTTADNKNRGWRFTGTLTANATVTVPATYTSFVAVNDTTGGFSLTVKTSAGTGVTVPNGRTASLRCNSVSVLNAFPTHMGTTFTPSLAGDAASVSYVQTAIATASLPATAGTWLVSGGDTTAGYGNTKINATGSGAASVSQSIGNPGGNETVDIAVSVASLALSDGGTLTGASAVASNTKYLCDLTSASYAVTGPAAPNAGDVILLTKFGVFTLTFNLNGLKFKGLTSNPVSSGEGQSMLRYTGASRGWVEM